ncbi:MAG TPA: CBS domain-containing protein [Gemmatimonadales bacterium]|jgi:acetoin utilization protein AcuB
MKVSEIMRTNLKTLRAEATVADAVAALAEAQVSALPVLDGHGRAVGVCSTRDVLVAESRCASPTARERLFEGGLVLEIMTPWPATASPQDEVRAVAQRMLDGKVQRLFVQENGRLVGVISQTDIVAAVAATRV